MISSPHWTRRPPSATQRGALLPAWLGGPARPVVLVPGRTPPLRQTRRRLGWALVGYTAALFLLAALSDRAVVWPGWVDVRWDADAGEVLLALLQGAALGALLAYVRRRAGSVVRAAALGLAFGLLVTGVRLLQELPLQMPILYAATAGGAAGALAVAVVLRRLQARRALSGLLALDYPLVGAVYLATPALWLGATFVDRDSAPLALLALALFGGSLAASVRGSRGPAAPGGVRGTATIVAAWVLVATAPLGTRAFVTWLGVAALAGLLAVTHAPRFDPRASDRRFEVGALRRALPLLLLYGLLLSTGPALADGGSWREGWEIALGLGRLDRLALVEVISAATLFGYVIAEWRGRREEPPAMAWRGALPLIAAVLVGGEVVRGLVPGDSAVLLRALLALAASRAGAALYYLQRDHVRALVRAGRGRTQVAGGAA